MTERAAPMCCPYCGDESIRPWVAEAEQDDPAAGRAQWRCEACTRVFVLRYKGISGR